jgi:Uma2 family endonuclease
MQLLDTHTPLLNTQSITLHVTREQFDALCHDNPELRLERTATGELIVMPPVSLDSSGKNLDLATDLAIWNPPATKSRNLPDRQRSRNYGIPIYLEWRRCTCWFHPRFEIDI